MTVQSPLSTDVPFAIVPLWLIESDVSDRGLRLYALLAGLRDYETGKCTPGRKWLAEKLRCSVDTVDRAKAELVRAGAVSVIQRREGLLNEANEYVVHRMPPSLRSSRTDAAGVAAGVAARMRPKQEENPDTSFGSSSDAREDGQLDLIGGAPATPAPTDFPVKQVRAKDVTEQEKALSRAIVATFNAKFGTDYRGREHYIDVVGRIRERPELTLEDHAAIIERFSHTTWWKRTRGGRTVSRPSISHVYGSGKALDAAAQAEPGDGAGEGPDLSEYDR